MLKRRVIIDLPENVSFDGSIETEFELSQIPIMIVDGLPYVINTITKDGENYVISLNSVPNPKIDLFKKLMRDLKDEAEAPE